MSRTRLFHSLLLAALLLAATAVPQLGQAAESAGAAGSGFTYQGSLTDGESPADGSYDFEFRLYDALSGGGQVGATVSHADVTVTSGLFSVALDFGAAAFTGEARWLEVAVRPGASTSAYTPLSPRQALNPTPYALYAANAAHAQDLSCTGCVSAAEISPSGLDADLLDGQHAGGFALAGHNHDAAYVNEGQQASITAAMILSGTVQAHHLADGATLSEIADDDGAGSGLNADQLDGLDAGAFAQVRQSGFVPAGLGPTGTFTLTIPNWLPFTLELASGWPDYGGLAFVMGAENDRYVAVTYMAYNGNGTSATGGAECGEAATTTLLSFGAPGSYWYTLSCPGEASGDHNLVLTAFGVELLYRLIY